MHMNKLKKGIDLLYENYLSTKTMVNELRQGMKLDSESWLKARRAI